MRTTIVLLAIAVLAVAVLGACRAEDDETPDSAAADTVSANDTVPSGDTVAAHSASLATSPRQRPPRSIPTIRRAGDTVTDSTLPPDDSIRAMRPEMPKVTPEKRPRTWRGFKLPEEMPVRPPVETLQQVERLPDSVTKGDSTKPLLP